MYYTKEQIELEILNNYKKTHTNKTAEEESELGSE